MQITINLDPVGLQAYKDLLSETGSSGDAIVNAALAAAVHRYNNAGMLPTSPISSDAQDAAPAELDAELAIAEALGRIEGRLIALGNRLP